MKVKYIRWSFAGILSFAACIGTLLPGSRTFGASASWTNGNYRFAGGTEPGAIALAVVFLVLYLLLMLAAPPGVGVALPGVVRRFFAFWLDFIIAMLAFGPLFGILVTISEWKRTGVFHWVFERDTPAAADIPLASVGALLAFAVLLFYFAIPLTRRRPSPGACVTGYQVVSDEGESLTLRRAMLRTVVGFAAMSIWPLTPFIARQRKEGKVWFDRVFKTHAIVSR